MTAASKYRAAGTMGRNWKCRCDCGKETIVGQPLPQAGKTKRCGCLDMYPQYWTPSIGGTYHGKGAFGLSRAGDAGSLHTRSPPDCFPAKNNRRYIQCTIGKACIHETSGTAAPSSARTPLSRIIRSRPSSFRLRRSFGSGKCGQTRITTAGNSQIICFLLVPCTENCCSLF